MPLLACERVRLLRLSALVAFAFALISVRVAAQTTVVSNPTTLVFTASADHDTILASGQPMVDHYSFDVYAVGAAQPFQQTNIGKPAPAADGTISYNFSGAVASWPLPGGNYEARVAAVGATGSGSSTVSNPFTFTTPCGVTLSGTAATVPAAGGGTQFNVTTTAGCAWTAAPSASWIAVSPASGTGSGTVVVTIAANTSAGSRTAAVSVSGQTFTVNQLGASCSFTLSSTAQSFAAAGGSGTVGVTGGTGCGWTAVSNASWITLTPASGSGGGTVSYTVAANTGSTSRSGTLTIAGATFTVNEAGATTTTALPSPWATQDIGTVELAGSASYSAGTFTVVGSGADIWGTTDAFRFVYQPFSGDGQLVARVTSETNTNYYAKAGIMLRTGLTATSSHVMLDLMPDGTIEFMTRTAASASTTSVANSTQAAPAWLRLVRSGTTVTASVSSDGSAWRTVGSTTVDLGTAVSAGLIVTSHDTTLRNTATFDNVSVAPATTTTGLPTPWANRDVGTVGLSGSASYSAGRFTVVGSGADIWGTADAFQFVYQPLTSDGQVVARVVSETNTNFYAKAGIMMRGDLTAGAPHVLLDLMPNGNIEFMTRTAAGASTTTIANVTQAAPVWLRLVRAGTTITASVSADGATWRTVGSTTTALAASVSTGLVVTSHDTTLRNTADFDNVSVSAAAAGLPSPWTNQDVGSVGLFGSATYSSSAFTVTGSGADIWGTTDAFQYVYQPMTGDGQVIARVVSETNTNYYAKAGIMLRASLAANAAHVTLDLLPGGGIEFLTRTTTGATTVWVASATQSAPAWLRLARTGSTVTASVSGDGTTWRTVGSTSISLGTGAAAGLVVTSHDTTLRNVAKFDSVSVQ